MNAVQLVANPAPLTFLRQPLNHRVLAGATNVIVFAEAEGGAITYQWFKNSNPIADATNMAYPVPTITPAEDGAVFYAVAANQAGTLQSSNAAITVGKLVTAPGLAMEELWFNAALSDVESGALDTVTPDVMRSLPGFESPVNQADTFSERISALFVPPVTGDYVFFVCSDDQSHLFISTDSSPSNKYEIGSETVWSNSRNWVGTDGGSSVSQKRSDQWVPDPANPPDTPPYANGIHLEAGQPYYIEADHNEGTGGDDCGVTYKLMSWADPKAGDSSRLTGVVLGAYAQTMDGATIVITNQPQNITATQSLTATFSLGAIAGYIGDDTGAGPDLAYQWQSAPDGSSTFTNIPDAFATSYTTPSLKLSDQGTQYRALLIAGDTNLTSDIAILSVTPPEQSSITLSITRAGDNVTVSWTPLGGALETAPTLGGSWTDVGVDNPAILPIGDGAAFFRVKQ